MNDPTRIAVVGAGLIGASWTALYLAHGCEVAVRDDAPAAEAALLARLPAMWADLRILDPRLPADPPLQRLSFHSDLAPALAGARAVQESITEQLEAKIALFAELDRIAEPDALLLSSTSAFRMSDIAGSCAHHPERCVVGHPFNPPHLVPLVEVVGGTATSPETISRAMAFYRAMAKHPVHLRKEVPGHVANRIQAAIMREVVSLVEQGVGDVAEIDDIVRYGPGTRWAVMGPTMVCYLGTPEHRRAAFPEGMAQFMHRMWTEELQTSAFGPDTRRQVAEGVHAALHGKTEADIEALRDRQLLGLLRLTRPEIAGSS